MKALATFLMMVLFHLSLAQLPEPVNEKLEDLEETEFDDQEWLHLMESYKRAPISINSAMEPELAQLRILTPQQITALIEYRKAVGAIEHIYELQSIPWWDPALIRKLLPFITVENDIELRKKLTGPFRNASQYLLVRLSRKWQNSYTPDYAGDPWCFLLKYQNRMTNGVEVGLLADKDVGEPWISRRGFDFSSFHLHVKSKSHLPSLFLGDFRVSMGQGLVQWQGMSFGKGSDLLSGYRQGKPILPYTSSGEYNFMRGAAMLVERERWKFAAFFSRRRVSSNLEYDSISGLRYITSIFESGYHRTEHEISDRSNTSLSSVGGIIGLKRRLFQFNINGAYHRYSNEFRKLEDPANYFSFVGNRYLAFSIDYRLRFQNTYAYGEFAADARLNKAWIMGFLISVDTKADLNFGMRNSGRNYHSLFASSVGEADPPNDEFGIFFHLALKPHPRWNFNLFGDIYQFSWLRTLIDLPAKGSEFSLMVKYSPTRTTEIYSRIRIRRKLENGGEQTLKLLYDRSHVAWRSQVRYFPHEHILVRWRTELVWWRRDRSLENGFMSFLDLVHKPLARPYSLGCRLVFFETDSYNSRIYALESDVLFYYSSLPLYHKGQRIYINTSYDITPNLSFWFKLGLTLKLVNNPDRSDPEKEIRLQIRYEF